MILISIALIEVLAIIIKMLFTLTYIKLSCNMFEYIISREKNKNKILILSLIRNIHMFFIFIFLLFFY